MITFESGKSKLIEIKDFKLFKIKTCKEHEHDGPVVALSVYKHLLTSV